MNQWNELLQQYDLTDILDQILGVHQNGSTFYRYHCPFHDDRKPSLIAPQKQAAQGRTQRCTCLAGCPELQGANIIDFLRAYYGLSFMEAVKRLDNSFDYKPTSRKVRNHNYDYGKIKRLFTPRVQHLKQKNFREALPYFVGRGLNEQISRLRAFTRDDQYQTYNTYELLSGKKLRFELPRYIIPRFIWDQVVSVNARRDDEKAAQFVEYNWETAIAPVIEDLQLRDQAQGIIHEYTISDIVEILFSKYKKWYTYGIPTDGIYNVHRLIQKNPDGQVLQPELSYVVVLESEFGAALLEQHGIMAVSTKTFRNVDKAFKNVESVYIWQDNDKPIRQKNGEFISAGQQIAEKLWSAMDHPNARIIKHEGEKSPDDFVRKTPNQALDWLRNSYGIVPKPLEYMLQIF